MILAGTPAKIILSGMDLFTKEQAPITEFSPITTPFLPDKIVVLQPIYEFFFTKIGVCVLDIFHEQQDKLQKK